MYKTTAYIYSLNRGKLRPEVMDEITILEERQDDRHGKFYIVDYKGVKCTAIFNPFVCAYFADDIYGIVKE